MGRAVRRAAGAPKGRDGAVEAIRALMVAKRSARNERTQAINQARSLLLIGSDDLRARFARHSAAAGGRLQQSAGECNIVRHLDYRVSVIVPGCG